MRISRSGSRGDNPRMLIVITSYSIHYTKLYEQGPPAATVGKDGNFLDVNEGCLRLYGYGREEFLV